MIHVAYHNVIYLPERMTPRAAQEQFEHELNRLYSHIGDAPFDDFLSMMNAMQLAVCHPEWATEWLREYDMFPPGEIDKALMDGIVRRAPRPGGSE